MALTSSSVLADALAQANNSGRWRVQTTTAMAIDRLEALEWLETNRPSTAAEEGSSISFRDRATEIAELRVFVAARDVARRQRFVAGRPT